MTRRIKSIKKGMNCVARIEKYQKKTNRKVPSSTIHKEKVLYYSYHDKVNIVINPKEEIEVLTFDEDFV